MSNWDSMVAECFPGASVSSEAPLAGDASTRSYVRLHLEGVEAPQTAIGMVLPEHSPAEGPELPFVNVQRYLQRAGVAVPRIYAARDRDLGRLLLEDMGDRALATALLDPSTTPSEADRLLNGVSDLLQALATARPAEPCVAFERAHDEALIRRELRMILSHGLATSDEGPALSANADPEARSALDRLGEAIAAQPRTLMHRDFHAWNLHVDPTGRLRVIDFQDAMLGPPTYDLASLCTDRDSDGFITEERERRLVGASARRLVEAGVYDDDATVERDYYQCVVFRTLRVIGRFRFLAIEDANAGYLHYIPRMAKQTKRALHALGEGELAHVLATRSAYFA